MEVYKIMLFLSAATLTPAAQWLMDVFFRLDYAILQWYHGLAESAGKVLTPIADVISYTGRHGLFLIVVAVLLFLLPRTRRTGMCCCIALLVGYILVNLLIKPAVARPRPYDYDATVRSWWDYVSALSFSPPEHDLSFPSGHMNATTALCAAVVLTRGKKWVPWMLLYAVLMGMSRNYLIVHYPSDVFFSFFTGLIAALIAWAVVSAIYKKWGKGKFLRVPPRGKHEK